jgi:hypothetical protein
LKILRAGNFNLILALGDANNAQSVIKIRKQRMAMAHFVKMVFP